MSEKKDSFLQRKNVTISFQRYGIQAMGAMALGLFASLLIGTIIKTVAEQIYTPPVLFSAMLKLSGDDLARMQRMSEVTKYGVIVVSTLPIIALYPFLQKYFVKGVMIGSLKG